ncbi:MAG: hypothetical protein ACREDR_31670 [Blastocatellia bacterium]
MLRKIAGGLAVMVVASAALGWTPAKNPARMPNKENPVSAIQIVVTGGDHNKPVDNASV